MNNLDNLKGTLIVAAILGMGGMVKGMASDNYERGVVRNARKETYASFQRCLDGIPRVLSEAGERAEVQKCRDERSKKEREIIKKTKEAKASVI